MVAVLLLAANEVVTRKALVDAVWDEHPPATAHRQMLNCASTVRRRFAELGVPATVLGTGGSGYRILVEPGQLDAQVFHAEVERARDLADQGRTREAVEVLRAGLALWHGPALADCTGQTFEAAVARLDEQRLLALELYLHLRLRDGLHDEAIAELAELVTAYPLREPLVGQLMLALHRSGRRAEALAAYQRLRARLADELGLDPGTELQQLHIAILRDDTGTPAPVDTPTAPRQLPAAARHFVGRAAELKELTRLLDEEAGSGTVVISAIDGTAGIGKTALALLWAHQVAPRFPDGQLYVNLRGYGPTGAPMPSGDAVRSFLDAWHVPAERVPVSADAQAALYRTLVAGRRVLIVLDNARDVDQVRPLLPGSASCLVLVTSRSQLIGLVAGEGAHPLTLDLLSSSEAHDLLVRHLGEPRVADDPAAVEQLVSLCGRLPLALAIVAARATGQPHFPLSAFVAELADAHRRLDALDAGDPGTRLRAVFSWSYERLSEPAARLFRLLGLHPGPDVGVPAAASLAGVPARGLRPLLAELTRAHLLIESRPGRYTFHDLLRAYAAGLAAGTDEHLAATRRVVEHYLHSAFAADRVLDPRRGTISVAAPGPGVWPEAADGTDRALAWFTAERAVLLLVVAQAAAAGLDVEAWQLAWTLSTFLNRQGHYRDMIAAQEIALAATRRLGDQVNEARAYNGLGLAYSELGHYREAATFYRRALDLFAEFDDVPGQARAHMNICWVLERRDRYRDAMHHSHLALDLFRKADQPAGQADALNNIGWYHGLLGDHHAALVWCRQALAVQEEVGNVQGQADAWDSIGVAHHHLDQHAEAVDCYRRAVEMYRQIGDRAGEGDVLVHLGDSLAAVGDHGAAREAWQQAVVILAELERPDADEVRAKLHFASA